jgi:uncharacterized protein DUF6879
LDRRITDLNSAEFAQLCTCFRHTAYRLETLQQYGVGYEDQSFRAYLAGEPMKADQASDEWTAVIRDAIAGGKIFQPVHLVREPLSDYMRYELEWWYEPNSEAGDDVRLLPARQVPAGELATFGALGDYWLFDSSDLWVMEYDGDGKFVQMEQVSDPGVIVSRTYWRDAALHYAIPYIDYMRRTELRAAS